MDMGNEHGEREHFNVVRAKYTCYRKEKMRMTDLILHLLIHNLKPCPKY